VAVLLHVKSKFKKIELNDEIDQLVSRLQVLRIGLGRGAYWT